MRIRWGHLCCVYEADFDVSKLLEHFTAMMISDQAYVCVCFSMVGGVGLGWGLD